MKLRPNVPQRRVDANSFNMEQLQASLPQEYPSFVSSHISGNFFMDLPKNFGVDHLPSHGGTIILVDENEREFSTKLSMSRSAPYKLCGGWKDFCISHNLQEGDVLVFQLTEPCKFKVHIRPNVPQRRVASVFLERARELQASLPQDYPSFVKVLRPSLISGDFVMDLKKKFCVAHLPSHDGTIILVDKNEQEWSTNFLAKRGRLYSGWKDFCISHNLQEGDVLVFQLTGPCKFKVYILISRNFIEIDDQSPNLPEITTVDIEDSHEDQDPSGNNNTTVIYFRDIKRPEDFRILVDGEILNSEMPTSVWVKYYELCRSQRMFLHEDLVEGISRKVATAVITETIEIADHIRDVESTIAHEELESWDRTLRAFEKMGMVVGFLRTRVDKLLAMCRESQLLSIDDKISAKGKATSELTSLKKKVFVVEAMIKRMNVEIEDLKARNLELNSAMKKVASGDVQ